ncbi:MAG: hypothetical protein ACWA41_04360 [Putridiphycobacter sp.]
MKDIKINIDRPKLTSEDIKQKMNFENVLNQHQLMHKPFYKSPWFFGVAGLSSLGLIASVIYHNYSLPPGVKKMEITELSTENPPNQNLQIAYHDSQPLKQESINLNKTEQNNQPIDKKSTLNQTTNQKPESIELTSEVEISKNEENAVNKNQLSEKSQTETKKTFNFFDLHPRIAGKVNGDITKKELLDEKGLQTNTNVNIVHFELHLVDGHGGKVFLEDSNVLNQEMKVALENVHAGDEIYFENINGETEEGKQVRLSPLRYTLLN